MIQITLSRKSKKSAKPVGVVLGSRDCIYRLPIFGNTPDCARLKGVMDSGSYASIPYKISAWFIGVRMYLVQIPAIAQTKFPIHIHQGYVFNAVQHFSRHQICISVFYGLPPKIEVIPNSLKRAFSANVCFFNGYRLFEDFCLHSF